MKRMLILLAAVLGALVLYVDLSGSKFRERIELNRKALRDGGAAEGTGRTGPFDASTLPKPVRKYLQYALGGHRSPYAVARIRQSGSFRVNETDNWVPVAAEQYLLISKPSFVWQGRMQPHAYLWTESQDALLNGSAFTEHRLYSAFLFQHYAGKASDLSGLARYLTEAPWLPTALLPSKHLSWFPIDATTARAVLTFNGCQVSADFFFNKAGEIVRVATADRSLFRSGAPQKHPWSANYRRYEQHKGIKVPMEMESEWNFEGRSFSYAKLHVESITFEGK